MNVPGRRLLQTMVIGVVGVIINTGIAQTPELPKAEETTDSVVTPTVESITADARRLDGLFPVFIDDRAGTIWLLLPAPDASGHLDRVLMIDGLAAGLGSNPVGLDRGRLGKDRLVDWRLVGGRVVLEEVNVRFRADRSDNAAERDAVRTSFATSILWAGPVAATTEAGETLVDITDLVVRDTHGIARTLKASDQGTFKLDADRSMVDGQSCHAFPDNIALQAILTFGGDDPGRHVRSTTPEGTSVTLLHRLMFVRLPDDGYTPRRFDPRVASFGVSFSDYSVGLDESIDVTYLERHRLQKTDPQAARSTVVEPIVYYVDPGAPEPIRSALIDGASWWADAFEAAGFIDAYRVEVLPEGIHPLDIRYNVIQWVHRSTRGWSYGRSVSDPRTGEIIKGHVSLGSLRVRQDRLIFEGLLGTSGTGRGGPSDPIELSLARIRQLAAHEVGHTLGFAHNFAGSTYGDRASVMDYPAPLITVDDDGQIDCGDAYGVGIGIWDIHCVRYAYEQFASDVDEAAALEAMIQDAEARGYRFMSDGDSRSMGDAHPYAALWDNGDDPVQALRDAMHVRRVAIDRFDATRILPGQPMARLHEVFIPVYLHHRYQIDAAAKSVGGAEYRYSVRGPGTVDLVTPVSADTQRAALAALLEAIDPATLDIPDDVLAILHPRGFGVAANRELLAGRMSPTFDALAAADVAVSLVLDNLLHPARCLRLVDQHRRNPTLPDLMEVLDAVRGQAFGERSGNLRLAAIEDTVRLATVRGLMRLVVADAASGMVAAQAEATLARIASQIESSESAVDRSIRTRIQRFLERPMAARADLIPSHTAPPGSPIGNAAAPGACGCDR